MSNTGGTCSALLRYFETLYFYFQDYSFSARIARTHSRSNHYRFSTQISSLMILDRSDDIKWFMYMMLCIDAMVRAIGSFCLKR